METTAAMAKPTTVTPAMVKPTMVMPASASQDVAAEGQKNFPKWDPAFKTSSLRKAKAKMPKTYLELVLVNR